MALTPRQLKEHLEARQKEASRTRIQGAIEEIDASLVNHASFIDVDSDAIATCVHLDITDEDARAIESEYLKAGWNVAAISRSDNSNFCMISLRTTDMPSL